MDYRIEKKEATRILCRKKQVAKPQGDTAAADISAFWAACRNDGTIETLCQYGCFDQFQGILGICFSSEMAGCGFPYGIGVEYDGRPIDDDLEVVTIPAHTYAVFTSKGKMPDAFIETYHRIVTEFFPQSAQYEYAENVEFEVYSSADISDPDYQCEIWIAVNEKEK